MEVKRIFINKTEKFGKKSFSIVNPISGVKIKIWHFSHKLYDNAYHMPINKIKSDDICKSCTV